MNKTLCPKCESLASVIDTGKVHCADGEYVRACVIIVVCDHCGYESKNEYSHVIEFRRKTPRLKEDV